MWAVLPGLVLWGAMAGADESGSAAPGHEEQQAIGQLSGTWEGYAVEGNGENPDRGPVHLRLIIEGQKIKAIDLGDKAKEQEMGHGTFRLDPGKSPQQIDATGILLPGRRERSFQGIYEVEGDTLRWCVDNRGKERPEEFRTIGGKFLLVLKRQKP